MKQFPHFELYLFDLDDTLINTRFSYKTAQDRALIECLPQNVLKEHQKQLSKLQWLCNRFGSGNLEEYTKAFWRIININGRSYDELTRKQIKLYKKHFWNLISPLPGSIDFLESLRNKGKLLALVSNGKKEIQELKLQTTGFNSFFQGDNIFVSDQFEARYKKPSPFMLQLACESKGISPSKTVYFGNVIDDVLAGNLAKVFTVFLGEKQDYDASVPDFAQPKSFLTNWMEVNQTN